MAMQCTYFCCLPCIGRAHTWTGLVAWKVDSKYQEQVLLYNCDAPLPPGISSAVSVQVLSGKLDGKDQEQVWLDACNASFAAMIKDKQSREAEEAKATVGICPLLLKCKRMAFDCMNRCCTHAAARARPLVWQ